MEHYTNASWNHSACARNNSINIRIHWWQRITYALYNSQYNDDKPHMTIPNIYYYILVT